MEFYHIIASVIFLYFFIPFFLTRILNIFVKKRNYSGNVSFTFDDGPHPEFTPLLLDVLKENNVKATFFVLGSRAEKYPDIIKRIFEEGHDVGVHNYYHNCNLFMTPKKVKKQIQDSIQLVENITGTKTELYRPPWGLLSVFDLFTLKRYRVVLWSVMVGDWKAKLGSEEIKRRLLKLVKPGDIVCLHDSGDTIGADTFAPLNTISSLTEVFNILKEKQIGISTLDKK